MSQPKQYATIRVPSLKVAVPLRADALPVDLVPMEGPAGEPMIDIIMADEESHRKGLYMPGSSLTVRAKLNGKNLRKNIRLIAEHGPEAVAVVLQGALKLPGVPGGPFILEGAGLQVVVKQPKPAPAAEAAQKGGG